MFITIFAGVPALIHWEVKVVTQVGGRSMKDVGGAVLAGSTPPFLGRERAAVDVDVGPERRSPRYHETYLALESIKEGSAAVSKPRGVWLHIRADNPNFSFRKKGEKKTSQAICADLESQAGASSCALVR